MKKKLMMGLALVAALAFAGATFASTAGFAWSAAALTSSAWGAANTDAAKRHVARNIFFIRTLLECITFKSLFKC